MKMETVTWLEWKATKIFFAFAYSKRDAILELKYVVEMIMDYHVEQAISKES